jgi:hypothetical protein
MSAQLSLREPPADDVNGEIFVRWQVKWSPLNISFLLSGLGGKSAKYSIAVASHK